MSAAKKPMDMTFYQSPASELDARLPRWNDKHRAVPNAILRSAVFGAVRRGNRKVWKKLEPLASVEGVQVLGFGIQLDQADMDVWQMALNLAKEQALGTVVSFSAKSFLTAIGRTTGKTDREWLADSLRRLSSFGVEISVKGVSYHGNLIHEFYVDEETGRYKISINPKLKDLFDAGWTQVDFDVRQRLKGKQLALWLAGFYASHDRPYNIKPETLRRLSGCESVTSEFKRLLSEALDDCVKQGAFSSYDITPQGLVRVIKARKRPEPAELEVERSVSGFDISDY